MKKITNILKKGISLLAIIVLMNSCGTIIGGAKYYAHVEVKGHPDASIYYQGEKVGEGKAKFLHKRNKANKLELVIKKEGCKNHTSNYTSKVPRLGPVLSSVSELVQMATSSTLVIPAGTIIDFLTGGYFKPNVSNPEITKMDYDNFKYSIKYTDCQK